MSSRQKEKEKNKRKKNREKKGRQRKKQRKKGKKKTKEEKEELLLKVADSANYKRAKKPKGPWHCVCVSGSVVGGCGCEEVKQVSGH